MSAVRMKAARRFSGSVVRDAKPRAPERVRLFLSPQKQYEQRIRVQFPPQIGKADVFEKFPTQIETIFPGNRWYTNVLCGRFCPLIDIPQSGTKMCSNAFCSEINMIDIIRFYYFIISSVFFIICLLGFWKIILLISTRDCFFYYLLIFGVFGRQVEIVHTCSIFSR